MFDHNPESKEDIHLAYIEWKKTSLPPPEYKRAAIVFQPTAQASPASTKTNRRPAGSLGVEMSFFSMNVCQMDVFFGFRVMVKYLNTLKNPYDL